MDGKTPKGWDLLGPGIYHGIPAEHYFDLPYASNSFLKKLHKCPAAAKVVDEDDTKARIFGRAAHTLTLEGDDAFNSEFIVLPDDAPKKPSDRERFAKKPSPETLFRCDWWDRFTANSNGKAVTTRDDYSLLRGVRDAAHGHPFAKMLLAEGVSETTVIFDVKIAGMIIRCKCRPDRTPSVEMATLIDLKTTADASEVAFLRDAIKFGYIQQAAFYIDGYNSVRHLPMKKNASGIWEHDKKAPVAPEMDAFAFIAVEKKAPFMCEVYPVKRDFLMWGRGQYEYCLKKEAECRNTRNPATGEMGYWPAYSNAGAQDLIKPSWL
jgi:hypothetical protein